MAKTNSISVAVKCPTCGEDITLGVNVSAVDCATPVRAGIRPAGNAFIYQITSDMIEKFIQQKASQFVPGIKVACAPITPKEKRAANSNKCYSFLKIAFSEAALDGNSAKNWYEKIGEAGTRLVPELFNGVVQKYKFDREKVNNWLKNYQQLEYLEKFFGITTEMLETIKDACTPRSIKDKFGATWIWFAAAPEAIIMDMLGEVGEERPAGKVSIMDSTMIAKGQMRYTVYLYPDELPVQEDAYVRQILLGGEKK